ncbi:MAG: hypothetical protein ACJAZO_002494 [Myxococcota bacterium]|jgi:hypothetical protein
MSLHKLSALAFLALFTACDGGDNTDTDMDSDSDTDTAEVFDSTITAADFLSGLPTADVTFDINGTDFTTDADGVVMFNAPDGTFQATASLDDYLDSYWTFFNDGATVSLYTVLVSDIGAGAIANAVGGPLDTTKGVVVVSVFGTAANGSAPGVGVALDTTSRVSLAADSAADIGFSAGATTLADSNGWIVFIDVPAGEVTATLTPSGTETCTLYPGDIATGSFTVVADAVNHVSYTCE